MKTATKRYDPMGLIELREAFGLNLSLMAMYLKIKVNSLKSVEAGRRSLPIHSLLLVADLEKQKAENIQPVEYRGMHPLESNYAEEATNQLLLLDIRESKCRDDEALLAGQLESMTMAYRLLRKRIAFIDSMVNQKEGEELLEWKTVQTQVARLLGRCGIARQQITAARLKIIRSEIECYGELKQQLENLTTH